MKNIPTKIYLQINGDCDATIDKSINDFNELFKGAITWSEERINDTDIEYKLSVDNKELTIFDADRIIKSKKFTIATKGEFILYCKINIDKPRRYVIDRLDTEIFSSSKIEPAIEYWNLI